MVKFVYVLGLGETGHVKVGVSDNPFKRMVHLANRLGVKYKDCWAYVSSLQKEPFLIENMCHKALSKYNTGGFGPDNLYPNEIFKCELDEARCVVDSIIEEYEKEHPRFNRAKLVLGDA